MDKKLQVFVSSTYTDLKEERQAAVEAILDAGHIPAGMELFKAGNESQLQTIYKWINESDVYMLILGGRYGSIEEKTGKSYTQLEYEYALSKNIPVFAVVLSDSFLTQKINTLGLSNVMEQKNQEKYQIFKSTVMYKIIRKVDNYHDIKIAILTSLNQIIDEYNPDGWVRNVSKHRKIQKDIYISQTKIIQGLISQLDNIQFNLDSVLDFLKGYMDIENSEINGIKSESLYIAVNHNKNIKNIHNLRKNIHNLRKILYENKFETQKYENDIQNILIHLEEFYLEMVTIYMVINYCS